jgi:hypothetical protein
MKKMALQSNPRPKIAMYQKVEYHSGAEPQTHLG